MGFTILSEIVLRTETPLVSRLALLFVLLLFGFLYSINRGWFHSLKLLSLLPFQRFGWQSEKHGSDYLLRISSFLVSISVLSILINGYQLGETAFSSDGRESNIFFVLLIVVILFVVNFLVNKIFFWLHQLPKLGDAIIDYQYSVNQWFAIIIGLLLVLDFFYVKQTNNIETIIMIVFLIYFLIRLFGTIVIFQNNFRYPILTVFVYLCTFEIVPALVLAKVLFVNS